MSKGNLLEVQAREQAGMPAQWQAFRYECFPHTNRIPTLYYEIEGAVVPLATNGKNKGRPQWKLLDKTTRRTVTITVAEHETWTQAWELTTGQCSRCSGSGQIVQRVSITDGTEYRVCGRCGGSGLSPEKKKAGGTNEPD